MCSMIYKTRFFINLASDEFFDSMGAVVIVSFFSIRFTLSACPACPRMTWFREKERKYYYYIRAKGFCTVVVRLLEIISFCLEHIFVFGSNIGGGITLL
jgi:hypothetical protein